MSYPNVPPGTPGSPAPMGPPGGVPVYGVPAPGGPPIRPRSQRTGLVIVAIIAVLAIITGGLAAYFFITRSGTDDAGSGEIFLEAAAAPGPDPFTTQIKVDPPPSTTATTKASTTSTTAAPTTSSGVTAVAATTGAKAGLYGGTMNNGRCDSAQLVSFLETNPDKAAAWVSALNRDPTLRWSGGTQVQVSQIRAYVSELTPLTLTGDTRVTNYGFSQGRATSRQAVLQAGTAVLVDRYGVPRTKCGCGNPLTKPTPVRQAPVYRNDPWPGWNPATVIVVQETTIVINNFTIVNLDGSGYIDRPAGTTGREDTTSTYTGDAGQPPGTTATTEATTTTIPTTTPPPTTPVPTLAPADFCAQFREAQARWSGIDADTPSQRQALAEEFVTLTAAAPPEIKADMEILRDFIKPLLLSGDLAQVFNPPAEVNTATVNIEAYLRNVCGIST